METIILNDRYRLDALLGTGGMAAVYRAHDLLLDRLVSVKVLREPFAGTPEFRNRFLEEARAAARLDHPNVVRIYDVGLDQSAPFIIMELVRGEDLKTLIRQQAPLSAERALHLAQQICAGVGYAHRNGIVHCDVKPHNILVTPDDMVKVADFGIARALYQTQPLSTEENVVWGSPHYVSPEQARGEPLTPSSDVYSIGVILYEMLTGVPPFHADDTDTLLMKHLTESPAPMTSLNPRVPPRLEELVAKVLAKEPAARYRHADQLSMAIDAYREQSAGITGPYSRTRSDLDSELSAPREVRSSRQTLPLEPAIETPEPPHREPDWLLWGLWVAAALAVLGLIPLLWRVYQVYSSSPQFLPPGLTEQAGTVTVTPAPMVGVPNLAGLSIADGQQRLEEYGLALGTTVEQESAGAIPNTILEQTPRAGSLVPIGAKVALVVARGPWFVLPDLIGYQYDTVVPQLEEQGLQVITEDVWSMEPVGKILAQIPPASTQLRAGDVLTLTLSGGTDQPIPLNVNLSGRVMLENARLPQMSLRPGDSLAVTLQWRCLQPVDQPYIVFVHLLQADAILAAQADSQPMNGLSPTNTWQPGDVIVDPHQIGIPSGIPAGSYQIRVGLYTGTTRLPVTDAGAASVVDNSILISTVQIIP
ncbi:MAG: protein kinase [Anaerolineae bacterium]|nr:protein kinase [Anaerolineae bacterium]